MSALFDDKRGLVLVILLIIVAGLSSLFTIPMAEDPRITNRAATILTPFPGASAERVERLVSQPLEDELRQLPEVKEVSSTSSVGLSSVRILLDDVIIDSETVFSKARDAVSDVAVSLPAGTRPPEFIDERGYAFTVLAAIRWTSESEPNPLILRRAAEELESRLIGVPGTDYTEIKGVGPEEIAVTLDADTAQSLGISEAQIAAILQNSDAKGAAGELVSDRQRSSVEVRGEFTDLDRIRDVIVSSSADGTAQVQLGDIASVTRGVRTPEESFALVEGQRAIIVGTRMQDGLRVSTFAQDVRDTLAEFQAEMSAGTELQIIFDQSVYSEERFAALGINLMIGVGLVVLILLLTLGLRSALIVGTVIPLTALAAIAVMNFTGVKLHQMSVTGLIVALGLLVDAAIVICDAVGRRLRTGMSAREAVRASVERLWLPLLSSTITTVLAFLPITLLPGGPGEFVGPIADSVIIALLVSLALALTVTAALAGLFLKAGPEKANPMDRVTAPIGHAFKSALQLSLRYPLISIAFALILPVAGFVSVTKLPSQFFPAADRQQFHVQIEMEPQAGVGRTLEAVAVADDLIEGTVGITSAHWFVGQSVMPFYYNLIPSRDRALNFAEAMVTADQLDGLYPLQDRLQVELERALPDARVLVRTIVQGPPTAAPVELRISGPDLGE
ncbi:MAG: efflux RND transporter permease subunit, partial [Pseudomonadota bacterium]